jgi:hypothetical protein
MMMKAFSTVYRRRLVTEIVSTACTNMDKHYYISVKVTTQQIKLIRCSAVTWVKCVKAAQPGVA